MSSKPTRALKNLLLPGVVAVVVAQGSMAAAGGYVFRWGDERGQLHLTDELGQVPEPYYSLYAAKLRELEAKRRNGEPAPERSLPEAQPVPAPPLPSVAAQEAERRAAWKAQ